MSRTKSLLHSSALALGVLLLVATGCATTPQQPPPDTSSTGTDPTTTQPEALGACAGFTCNISDATWTGHIQPRHCTGCVAGNKSAFVAGYCTDKAAAVSLCQTVLAAGTCSATQQPNTRWAVTATLGATVGQDSRNSCNNTSVGTVIFESDKSTVVTQFPGSP